MKYFLYHQVIETLIMFLFMSFLTDEWLLPNNRHATDSYSSLNLEHGMPLLGIYGILGLCYATINLLPVYIYGWLQKPDKIIMQLTRDQRYSKYQIAQAGQLAYHGTTNPEDRFKIDGGRFGYVYKADTDRQAFPNSMNTRSLLLFSLLYLFPVFVGVSIQLVLLYIFSWMGDESNAVLRMATIPGQSCDSNDMSLGEHTAQILSVIPAFYSARYLYRKSESFFGIDKDIQIDHDSSEHKEHQPRFYERWLWR